MKKCKIAKRKNGYYNLAGKRIDNLDQSKLSKIIGKPPKNGTQYTTSGDGFQYFEASDVEKIGLSKINQSIIINFNTREVYSYSGLEIDGKYYYKLQELNYSAWNVN